VKTHFQTIEGFSISTKAKEEPAMKAKPGPRARAGSLLMSGAVIFLAAQFAAPASALEVGEIARGYAELNGRQIPLPDGDWTLAGKGRNGVISGVAGAFGTIDSNVLFKIDANRVRGIVEVNTNSISVNEGWGTTRGCSGEESLARFNLYRTAVDGLCFFVNETAAPLEDKDGPKAWRQAIALAKERGLVVPETWLTIGYRISNRYDIMDARYHLDGLELEDRAPGKSAWTTDAVESDPEKQKTVMALNAWAGLVAEFFESGLRGRLPEHLKGLSAPRPLVVDDRTAAEKVDPNTVGLGSKKARKIMLARLAKEGVIAESDLEAYLAAVDETAPPPTTEDYYKTLVAKTASYNFFRVSVDYLLAYIVTTNAAVSGYITASIVFFHSIAQVINDVTWDNYISGQKRDGSELVEFHYIGRAAEPTS
jgi:uncharacterized membrane protein